MSHPYETFSAAQFLTDDAFVDHQLSPTSQSTALWHTWLEEHPNRQQEWQKAVDLLAVIQLGLDDYRQTYLSEETIRQLFVRIQRSNAPVKPEASVYRLTWVQWVAAASVVLVLGIGIWWQMSHRPSPSGPSLVALKKTVNEKINTTQTRQIIRLPDSSVVLLTPNSRLSYGDDFGQRDRTVYLSGEASFDVTKDAQTPFFVHASEVVTKVIGTRFVVRAFAGEDKVRVQVQSGQVSVYHNEPTDPAVNQKGVLLLPNQQVVFNRQAAQFIKMLVAVPRLIIPSTRHKPSPTFIYTDTPIERVLQELKEAYGIEIRYNKEALADCQLTSSMTNESFEQKLKIVCATVGATYELIDGQVIINGGSCQYP